MAFCVYGSQKQISRIQKIHVAPLRPNAKIIRELARAACRVVRVVMCACIVIAAQIYSAWRALMWRVLPITKITRADFLCVPYLYQ